MVRNHKLKSVLIISYNFPPEGGPAVQRVAKFCKYWQRSGLNIFVLTAEKKHPVSDPSLLVDVNAIQIHKTRDWGNRLPGDLKKLLRRFLMPDNAAFWRWTAVKKGIALVKHEKIDLIFSTSPPHSSHVVAEKIARHCNIPWITDFRDEWSHNPSFHKQSSQHKQIQLETRVLASCNHIVAVTEKARNNFVRMAHLNKTSLIRNGFDKESFMGLNWLDFPVQKQNKTLKIAYAGRLNQLHNPIPFFIALDRLLLAGKLKASDISVEIIGNLENRKWIKNFPRLKKIVQFTAYMPHEQVLSHLANADALLLLATGMQKTEFFPAKVFEYFKLEKAIFAIVTKQGELWQVISEYGKAWLAQEADIEKIENQLLDMHSGLKTGRLHKPVNRKFVNQFCREKQAKALIRVMENVVERV